MSEAGADAAVIQAYVENSPVAYNLRAEEIIYLKDHGISTTIITAMIQRGAKLREQAPPAQAAAEPGQPLPPAVTATEPVQTTAPAYSASPTYVYPSESASYPNYAYNYPNYYPYYPWYPTFGLYFSRPYYYVPSFGSHHGPGVGGSGHSFRSGGSIRSTPRSSSFHH